MAKASKNKAAGKISRAVTQTAPTASPPPPPPAARKTPAAAVDPEAMKLIESLTPLQLEYARKRWVWLKATDLPAVRHLLGRKELTAHLVAAGRSAAVHRQRLNKGNTPAKQADKEVTEQWVSGGGGEVPDPLPPGDVAGVTKAIADYEAGEGKAFAGAVVEE